MVSSLMTPTMITATFSTPALTTKWMERTSVGNCWCCECCPALPSLYVITWHSEHQAMLITNIYPSIKNVKWKQGSVTRVAWWGGGLSRILMLLGTSLLDTVVFFFLPLPCKSTSGYRGQNTQEAFFYYWTHNLFIFFLDRGRWKNIGRWLTHKNNNPDKNQISHISKQTSPISKLLSW